MVKSEDLRKAADPHTVTEIDNSTGAISLINTAELNQRIECAHRYPRSLTKFMREALDMATISEDTAKECIYSLPRREWDKEKNKWETKMITGPSVRLAEILIAAWTNTRTGARVVEEGKEFVTAQGMFYDLERNTDVQFEVKRRITTAKGDRFSPDMIATTANAACSIALRNAVTRGIPKALWTGIEKEVRKVIAGDAKTVGARRDEVLARLNKMGISHDRVYAALEIGGISDVGLDEIVILNGLGNAIREGEITIDEAFPPVVFNQAGQRQANKQPDPKPEQQKTQAPTENDKLSEEQAGAIARMQTESFKEQLAGENKQAAERRAADLPPEQTAKFDDDEQPNMLSTEEQARKDREAAESGKPTFIEITQSIAGATSALVIQGSILPMISEVPNPEHQKILTNLATNKIAALMRAQPTAGGEAKQNTAQAKPTPTQPQNGAPARRRTNAEMD